MYEVHDHANPLGHIGDLQGALVLGIGYQLAQSIGSLLACTKDVAVGSAPRVFTYLGICAVQIIVYSFFVLRASNRLGQIWRPSSIAFTRKVLWFAGPGMIVSTWILQAIVYRSWPVTPDAWLLILLFLTKLPHPLAVLTIVALAQALCIAALWNRFLSRYGKVAELFSDPEGEDWRVYWREYKAKAQLELREEKARERLLKRR